jgi:hypothetical protein
MSGKKKVIPVRFVCVAAPPGVGPQVGDTIDVDMVLSINPPSINYRLRTKREAHARN